MTRYLDSTFNWTEPIVAPPPVMHEIKYRQSGSFTYDFADGNPESAIADEQVSVQLAGPEHESGTVVPFGKKVGILNEQYENSSGTIPGLDSGTPDSTVFDTSFPVTYYGFQEKGIYTFTMPDRDVTVGMTIDLS